VIYAFSEALERFNEAQICLAMLRAHQYYHYSVYQEFIDAFNYEIEKLAKFEVIEFAEKESQ
jgi:hypothetical protein